MGKQAFVEVKRGLRFCLLLALLPLASCQKGASLADDVAQAEAGVPRADGVLAEGAPADIAKVAMAQIAVPTACGVSGVAVQVLGSGGPEITYNDRASSGYLVWVDGKARVLVDAGAGTAANFGRSGAQIEDLDAIVLSHLHVDHSADLPAFVKASFFGERREDLPLFGPTGNQIMPATTDYVRSLFGADGAFRYLKGFADPELRSAYHLLPQDLEANGRTEVSVFKNERLELRAIPVTHGPLPALAWRVNAGGHSISFSGDMSGTRDTLPELAKTTDLLIAHNAIPQTATGGITNLHMPPAMIGAIAAKAQPKHLLLSHRMRRSLGQEQQTEAVIRETYAGPISFANDMDCFQIAP